MALLSDRDILIAMEMGELAIDPFDFDDVQPASYDVHLYPTIKQLRRGQGPIDLNDLDAVIWDDIRVPDFGWVLNPDDFYLLSTSEVVTLSPGIACAIDGSSTLSRAGLTVHQTGQWVDTGWNGTLTFECKCTNGQGIIIYPEMKVGQLIFLRTQTPSINPYNGRYMGQRGPQPPRMKKVKEE